MSQYLGYCDDDTGQKSYMFTTLAISVVVETGVTSKEKESWTKQRKGILDFQELESVSIVFILNVLNT